jgi:murein DD-endopeptidase MepM/ murein hydrolase activator NlpD
MKIIIMHGREGQSRSLTLSPVGRAVLSLCLIGIPTLLGGLAGYHLAASDASAVINQDAAQSWRKALADQRQLLQEARDKANREMRGIAARVAQLQAHVVRLDALGENLVEETGLKDGEFDFSRPPALGGPVSKDVVVDYGSLDFLNKMDQLSRQIDDRWIQLQTLQGVLQQDEIADASFIAGLPVEWGWQSSPFGRRTDPFTGQPAWHKGVDYAGKEGSNIIATASGVVTWSGDKDGYGLMVEVNHGDGFVTRYGHNKKNNVKVGDVVKKGQPIAIMGNTGRSTGPHVHYEVYRHGRVIDPASYLRRTHR